MSPTHWFLLSFQVFLGESDVQDHISKALLYPYIIPWRHILTISFHFQSAHGMISMCWGPWTVNEGENKHESGMLSAFKGLTDTSVRERMKEVSKGPVL